MFHVRRPKAENDMTKNNTLGVCEKMQKDEFILMLSQLSGLHRDEINTASAPESIQENLWSGSDQH